MTTNQKVDFPRFEIIPGTGPRHMNPPPLNRQSVHEAFRRLIAEATEETPIIPPLSSDAKIVSGRLFIPRNYRSSLGLLGPCKLSSIEQNGTLELHTNQQFPQFRKTVPLQSCAKFIREILPDPREIPPETQRGLDAIHLAFESIIQAEENKRITMETSITARGHVTIDTRMQTHLGWQNGDRIRVVLGKDHLCLYRVI